MPAEPAMYARVFEGHHEGALILEELVRRFFDVDVYVPGPDGSRETDRRAARREVVGFILKQIGQVANGDPNDDATAAG